MLQKKPVDNGSIARRKERWEKCKYGALSASGILSQFPAIYCCTNVSIGRRWHLEKWQDYIIEVLGASTIKHINLDAQAYTRFGTNDVYALNPKGNFIECEKCPEFKRKRRPLSYW